MPKVGKESSPVAVVLLSGGLDSATTLAIALSEGFRCHAMSFRYGQRHVAELRAAERVAQSLGVDRHLIVPLDDRLFRGSALTDELEVPKDRTAGEMESGIPVTYVPARNTIFLAFALGYAESVGSRDIFIGVNAIDYSGYPDCRPEFVRAFEAVANLGTKAGVEGDRFRIHTPLIELTKAEIIRRGVELRVDFSLTLSCYDPDDSGRACGRCDSCQLRRKGFAEGGVDDPTRYVREEARAS